MVADNGSVQVAAHGLEVCLAGTAVASIHPSHMICTKIAPPVQLPRKRTANHFLAVDAIGGLLAGLFAEREVDAFRGVQRRFGRVGPATRVDPGT